MWISEKGQMKSAPQIPERPELLGFRVKVQAPGRGGGRQHSCTPVRTRRWGASRFPQPRLPGCHSLMTATDPGYKAVVSAVVSSVPEPVTQASA